jgi:hypothetical protein
MNQMAARPQNAKLPELRKGKPKQERRYDMRRWLPLIVACGIVIALGLSARAQGPRQVDCSSSSCTHLPLVANPPTPTDTPVTPTDTPVTPTKTPSLPPPTYNNCQQDPNPSAAPNYPVRIVAIDKSAETVTLRNVTTGDTIDLTNWQMCSITGNQHHPIFGTLAPGEQQTFPGPAGNIWNNSSSDPGALYNQNGQLVSY